MNGKLQVCLFFETFFGVFVHVCITETEITIFLDMFDYPER